MQKTKNNFLIKQKLLGELCNLYLNSYNTPDLAIKRLTKLIEDYDNLTSINFNLKYNDITKFEKTILELDSKSVSLIVHDFVFRDEKGWSDVLWSRTIYYSIKKQAINLFFKKLGV